VSGPLLDRIDLHIEVPGVPFEELSSTADGTGSAAMREQVTRVRALQRERYGAGKSLLPQAMDERGLAARAHDRILLWLCQESD
jgi:magnesium chelatase family protein